MKEDISTLLKADIITLRSQSTRRINYENPGRHSIVFSMHLEMLVIRYGVNQPKYVLPSRFVESIA